MTTPIVRHRLSPSGPFIGDPGIQAGPGSIGLVWRKHGTTSVATMPTTEPTAIAGLGGADVFTVNMQPGYLYDLEVVSGAKLNSTATVNQKYAVMYRLRDASTNAWGSWDYVTYGEFHTVGPQIIAAATDVGAETMCTDRRFSLAVTATANAIEIGALADDNDPHCIGIGEHWYAVVYEYMP